MHDRFGIICSNSKAVGLSRRGASVTEKCSSQVRQRDDAADYFFHDAVTNMWDALELQNRNCNEIDDSTNN